MEWKSLLSYSLTLVHATYYSMPLSALVYLLVLRTLEKIMPGVGDQGPVGASELTLDESYQDTL